MNSLGVIGTPNYAVYTLREVGLMTVQVYDAAGMRRRVTGD